MYRLAQPSQSTTVSCVRRNVLGRGLWGGRSLRIEYHYVAGGQLRTNFT